MGHLLDDVQYLSGTIGPRGTGTPGEKDAARYVANRLTDLGLVSEEHAFRTVLSQNSFPIAISLMALTAVAVYPLGWTVTRWVAVVLCLGAGWSLWQTIRNDFNPLNLLLPKVPSQNVEARLELIGEPRCKVVILAHLDTNRCRLIW